MTDYVHVMEQIALVMIVTLLLAQVVFVLIVLALARKLIACVAQILHAQVETVMILYAKKIVLLKTVIVKLVEIAALA